MNKNILINKKILIIFAAAFLSQLFIQHIIITMAYEELQKMQLFSIELSRYMFFLEREIDLAVAMSQKIQTPTTEAGRLWGLLCFSCLLVLCLVGGFQYAKREGTPPIFPKNASPEMLSYKEHLLELDWFVKLTTNNTVENIYVKPFIEKDRITTLAQFVTDLSNMIPGLG